MKNKILINSLRTIKRTFPRFLALIVICFLGAFTFSGLETTSSSMNKSLDRYLDNGNTYDIKLISTLGLTNDDINKINNIDGVNNVEGNYSKDLLISLGNEEYVLNVSSMTNTLNNLELIEGRMPSDSNEIVVEKNLLKIKDINLGDKIFVDDSNIIHNELTIVGTVDSTLYFNEVTFFQYRGISTIGKGQIDYYSFAMPSLFDIDYYSYIYITIDDIKNEITSSNRYNNKIENIKDELNKIKDECVEKRIDYLRKKLELTKSFLNVFITQYQSNINNNKIEYDKISNELNIQDENINKKIQEIENRIIEIESLLENIDEDDVLYQEYTKELVSLYSLLEKCQKLLDLENEIIRTEKTLKEYKRVSEETINEIERFLSNKNSKWFIMDRTSYTTYAEFMDYSGSLANIAKVFSSIFLAVSILICLVSMNRMIEDDRQEIGTLKSLGFSNKEIMNKYIIYSLSATLIGSVIGLILGPIVISKIVFNIFSTLFALPNYYTIFDVKTCSIGLVLLTSIVLCTTLLTIKKVVSEKPAELIRPKAPKKGTRVFVEKIKFIWNKLNFTNKVTIRNLFRYKKRAIVTLLGVAGCTSVLMAGFGLKNSFSYITERQIGEVFKFDALVYVNDYEIEDNSIFKNEKIVSNISAYNANVHVEGTRAGLFVFENDAHINDFISFNDYKTYEEKHLEDNKIIVTQKLADLKNIKVGDYLEYVDADNFNYRFEVSAINENYFEHYIYMNENTYKSTGQEFKPNLVVINTIELDNNDKEILKEELLSNKKVFNVSYSYELLDKVDTMINLLNKVILLVIILASLLSFVVLYNLSNINIYERKREIASLKVLGFYDKEVDKYINKENIILTTIGIFIGFIFGYLFSILIIYLIEIDKLFFIKNLGFNTYLYSGLLTILFTIIINFVSHFILKKINMIDSLKSVE